MLTIHCGFMAIDGVNPTSDCRATPGQAAAAFNLAKIHSLDEISLLSDPSTFLSGYTLATTLANFTEVYLTNGQWQPIVTVAQYQSKVLRMVNAGASTMKLYMVPIIRQRRDRLSRGVTMSFAQANKGCTMNILAADGVFFAAPRNRSTIYLSAGARYDIMFECSASDNLMAAFGSVLFNKQIHPIVIFAVSGTGSSIGSLTSALATIAATRPAYLADQSSISAVSTLMCTTAKVRCQ